MRKIVPFDIKKASFSTMVTISSMVLKYQIQHFSADYEAARQTKDKIYQAIDSLGFHGLKKEYESMFNGGTAHESFVENLPGLSTVFRILHLKKASIRTVFSLRRK